MRKIHGDVEINSGAQLVDLANAAINKTYNGDVSTAGSQIATMCNAVSRIEKFAFGTSTFANDELSKLTYAKARRDMTANSKRAKKPTHTIDLQALLKHVHETHAGAPSSWSNTQLRDVAALGIWG